MTSGATSNPSSMAYHGVISIQRIHTPHKQAMLAALRVVLGLPKKPLVVDKPDRGLAISHEQSMTVPDRRDLRPGGQA
jgi:hypothetical protein